MIELIKGSWRAQISEEGGCVAGLLHDTRPLLRTRVESADAWQFGMPLLMPANRTRNGRFVFEGKSYELPVNEPQTPANLHGVLYDQHFACAHRTEGSAVLRYENSGQAYPFPFALEAEYRLGEDGLYCRYTFRNTGRSSMPLTFALHTTFVEPDFCRVPLDSEQERDAHNLPTGRYIPLEGDALAICSGLDPRNVSLSGYYKRSGAEARIGAYIYRASEAFDHWVLYNAGGRKGILCVEPQMGGVDGLNGYGSYKVLQPGETVSLMTELVQTL